MNVKTFAPWKICCLHYLYIYIHTHVFTWISTYLKLVRHTLLTAVQPPKSSDGMYKASNYAFIYTHIYVIWIELRKRRQRCKKCERCMPPKCNNCTYCINPNSKQPCINRKWNKFLFTYRIVQKLDGKNFRQFLWFSSNLSKFSSTFFSVILFLWRLLQ